MSHSKSSKPFSLRTTDFEWSIYISRALQLFEGCMKWRCPSEVVLSVLQCKVVIDSRDLGGDAEHNRETVGQTKYWPKSRCLALLNHTTVGVWWVKFIRSIDSHGSPMLAPSSLTRESHTITLVPCRLPDPPEEDPISRGWVARSTGPATIWEQASDCHMIHEILSCSWMSYRISASTRTEP